VEKGRTECAECNSGCLLCLCIGMIEIEMEVFQERSGPGGDVLLRRRKWTANGVPKRLPIDRLIDRSNGVCLFVCVCVCVCVAWPLVEHRPRHTSCFLGSRQSRAHCIPPSFLDSKTTLPSPRLHMYALIELRLASNRTFELSTRATRFDMIMGNGGERKKTVVVAIQGSTRGHTHHIGVGP
jgi:hypothetical protein